MPVDPSAVKTWANLVTVARVLIAPFMFVLIPDKPGGSWIAFGLWFVLCSTDGIVCGACDTAFSYSVLRAARRSMLGEVSRA